MTDTFENSDVQRAVYELASSAGVISDVDGVPKEYAWRLKGPETFALTEKGSFALPILLALLDEADKEISHASEIDRELVAYVSGLRVMNLLLRDEVNNIPKFPVLRSFANLTHYGAPFNDAPASNVPLSVMTDTEHAIKVILEHSFWSKLPNMVAITDVGSDLQYYLVRVITLLTQAPYHDNFSHYIGIERRPVSWVENTAYAKPLCELAGKIYASSVSQAKGTTTCF